MQDSDVANRREMDAFFQFMSLEQFAIHNMRDHPWHGVTFLAGLWAVKLYKPFIREKMRESMTNIVEDRTSFMSRKEKSADYVVLERS